MTINVSSPNEQNRLNDMPSEQQALGKRLDTLYEERHHKLEGFLAAGKAIEDSKARLQQLRELPNAAAYAEHYTTMLKELEEMEELRKEYGNAFVVLGYEINEIHGDLAVNQDRI